MEVCTARPVPGLVFGGCSVVQRKTGDCLPRHQQLSCAQSGGLEHQKAPLVAWIPHMLRCEYFAPCPRHREQRKAEATFFCADCCCRPLCGHCTAQHVGHKLIQIRRYVYCDVVRAADMSPHMDISGVQTYIINQAKVMFLNQRPQSKMSRPGASDACAVCARTLREGCSYCSLACKVEALTGTPAPAPAPAPTHTQEQPASSGASPSCGLLKHASGGSASDSSDCWGAQGPAAGPEAPPASSDDSAGAAAHHHHHDAGAGDSSSSGSGQTLAGGAGAQAGGGGWGGSAQAAQQLQQSEEQAAASGPARQLGGLAIWVRRHSDSDSEGGRCSSGSFCARRKQASPRRSPLL